MIKTCKVKYTETENGYEAESTNYNLGRINADSTDEIYKQFGSMFAELLGVDEKFVCIQLNRVPHL